MLRLTLAGLRANKVRFALTTLGVTLAVSFVVSAFVLGDGLRSTFGSVSQDITAGIDVEVRPAEDFGDPPPLPSDTAGIVADVDGVAAAAPGIEAPWDAVQLLDGSGQPINEGGPPHIAWAWIDNPGLNAFTLVEGTAPGPDEFVVDLDTADRQGLVLGESYALTTPTGRVELTLVGTSSFGDDNATAGAVLVQMDSDRIAELLGTDGIDSVAVEVEDGADVARVQAAIAAAVPEADVVDHDVLLAEADESLTGEIDLVGNILLGFGGVALFVSVFIIYNTFAIVVGQRTKELALLRTVGADPAQIRRSVLGEALAIGLLGSVGGILGGIGVARGLEALFNAGSAALPDSPTILAARTVVAAFVVGVGVTLPTAIGPARRASTVPLIAALRDGGTDSAPGSRTRIISGVGLFVFGLLAGALGLSGAGGTGATVVLMAGGAVGVFLGVTLLSPMAVGRVTRVLGWPMARMAGVTGRLAQQNAARNPRRTATTGAALMVGLALVSAVLVVGHSVKQTLGSSLSEVAIGDYYLTDELDEVTFPLGLPAELAADDRFDAVSGFRYVETRIGDEVSENVAADFDQVPELLELDVSEGGYDTTVANPVLIASSHAHETGLGLGDTITTEFAGGGVAQSTITGVFDNDSLIRSDFLFDQSSFDAGGDTTGPDWVAVSVADGVDDSSVATAIDGLKEAFPAADIETNEEYLDRIEGMIDELLAVVNVMVALAVVIALIGIANTLALSVFERTRELGLVRAVGMSRRQLRRMIRFEAALVAGFGAVLGVSVGLLFGSGVALALPDSFVTGVAVPVGSIVLLVAVAAGAGVLAAAMPARRAARLDVLDAVSV